MTESLPFERADSLEEAGDGHTPCRYSYAFLLGDPGFALWAVTGESIVQQQLLSTRKRCAAQQFASSRRVQNRPQGNLRLSQACFPL